MISRTKSASSVRNLFVYDVPTNVLSAFTGLENLFTTRHFDDALIHKFPLKHLHCHYFGSELITHPSFSKITHLELFSGIEQQETQSALATLPHLTHFAVNLAPSILVCAEVLHINSLRAFIILQTPAVNQHTVRQYRKLDTLVDDVRFVMLPVPEYTADWQRGALTGRDYWARADTFIAKRSSGDIDRASFLALLARDSHRFLGRTFVLADE
jgi:hypothetical protein